MSVCMCVCYVLGSLVADRKACGSQLTCTMWLPVTEQVIRLVVKHLYL